MNLVARYAPMNHVHIFDFPNCMPCVDWQTYFPKFRDQKGDDATLHLVKFHIHVRKLRVQLPEDCLMNLFMDTLEGKSRSWYEQLPAASLCSLNHFHRIFFGNYKGSYPSLLLVQNCSDHFENFI